MVVWKKWVKAVGAKVNGLGVPVQLRFCPLFGFYMMISLWSALLVQWRQSWVRRRTRRLAGPPRTGARSEALETRVLLTVVSPQWFAVLDNSQALASQEVVAAPGAGQDWIIQLDQVTAAGLDSVADVTGLLTGGDVSYQVLRGLGSVGTVMVRTWGASTGEIRDWLATIPTVSSAQPDETVLLEWIPDDPQYPSMWPLEDSENSIATPEGNIDAVAAWNRTTGSRSVIAAVLDTGVDYLHPDLRPNMWVNPGEIPGDEIDNDENGFVDDIHGWNFIYGTSDPMDDHGHGTHVTGTIGAVGNNGVGVVGVNWEVSLMALKVLGAWGGGSNTGVIAALNYATMMKERGANIRVTNSSFGGSAWDGLLEAAITSARDHQIIFVAAAGNYSTNTDLAPFYPAGYRVANVVSVGASSTTDTLLGFSNYGRQTVELVAPGTSILSTLKGGGYGRKGGTSMASPHVAGTVALVAAMYPDTDYSEIISALLEGVDPAPAFATKTVSGGRLNIRQTLDVLEARQLQIPRGYLAGSTPYEAVELTPGENGAFVVLDEMNDGAVAIDLGSSTFRFYETVFGGAGQLYVSPNGHLTLGVAGDSSANGNLSPADLVPRIAPLWDDLRTDAGLADRVVARFDDTTGDGIPDRLIIEWQNVSRDDAPSTATFQAILQLNSGAFDGDIVFNYADVDFGNLAFDRGRSASTGISSGNDILFDRLLVSKDTGSNSLIESGKAIRLSRRRVTGAVEPLSESIHAVPVDSVDITFDGPINVASLNGYDVTITHNGVAVPQQAHVPSVSLVSGNTYRLQGLAGANGTDGDYALTIDLSGVQSSLGHPGLGTSTVTWTTRLGAANIKMLGSTADGLTNLEVQYEIELADSDPFDVGFYVSADSLFDAGDVLLSTVTLSAESERTVGTHSKSFPIGTGAGQIALPGFGTADLDSNYYILAVADPGDTVFEADPQGANSDNSQTFSGVYHAARGQVLVQGTTGDDVILSSAGTSLSFNGTVFTYSTADLTGFRIRAHGGDDLVDGSSWTKTAFIDGAAGNDTLNGGSQPDVVIGGIGHDVIAGNAGADSLTGGAGDDQLTGGSGNDRYLFLPDAESETDTVEENGGGFDTLDFSGMTTGVMMDLSITGPQTVSPGRALVVGSASSIETLVGGAGNDLLAGNSLSNTLIGSEGDDTLSGGGGSDTYPYNADQVGGSDTIVELDGGGTDILDFSTTAVQSVVIDLSLTSLQAVAPFLSLTLSSSTALETVRGGGGNDLLMGNSLPNSLTGSGGNDTLAGAGGADTYPFDCDAPVGSNVIIETDAGGGDTVDFSATTTKAVEIDLSTSLEQVVNSNLTLTIVAGLGIEAVIGGALNDSLTGNSEANSLTGGPGNDTLTGGGGDDSYLFDTDTALGTDTVVEEPGGGSDTLDFTATTSRAVAVDLSTTSVQAVNVNLGLVLNSGVVLDNVVGGSLADVLTGNSLDNTFDGRNGNDTITGGSGEDALTGGAGNDSLIGGAGNDVYRYNTNTALGSDQIVEDAGGGVDLIDLSVSTTLGATIDLSLTTSQVVNSNLTLRFSDGDAVDGVIGSSKNDVLSGNSLSNYFLGASGADTLLGRDGRDLLVGGSGTDVLDGGADDDLVLSGLLGYFSEISKIVSLPSIDNLLERWNAPFDYLDRVADLRTVNAAPNSSVLDATTVLNDGSAKDTLIGGLGADWFWIFGPDVVTDEGNGGTETVN